MTVYDLKAGESAEITKINATGGAAERLNSLGVVCGKRVTALAFSLFKSSVLIGCGAVRVGLRKALSQQIEVKLCEQKL